MFSNKKIQFKEIKTYIHIIKTKIIINLIYLRFKIYDLWFKI